MVADLMTTALVAAGRHPLLAAKMAVPRIRTPVIARPGLLARMSQGTEGPLTVVSAAPGAGKTVLMASWISTQEAPGPVAWLTLDAFTADPGTFWAYVVGTLRGHGAELPDNLAEPIRGDDVDRSFLVRLAMALAAQPSPVILVLDEFEHISSRDIARGLDFVLRNSAPNLRLVVLTRDPALIAVNRYELTGEVVRVDTAALAFTAEEAKGLLRQHGVQLPAEAVALLTELTGGLAAGLRLCAVAMQRRADPGAFIKALPFGHAPLTEYLLDEVLKSQSPEVRDFLLRTSVTDRLCPALAEALTGRSDGRAVLTALQTANVLTEALDDAPDWYRYHPLFAQVLRAELRRQQPDLVSGLHRKASAWLAGAGLLAEAVTHAAAAGDWQLAAVTVVRGLAVGKMLAGSQASHLASLFAAMPADEPGAMPALVRAAEAMSRFDLGSCRQELDAVARQAAGEAASDRTPLLMSAAVVGTVLGRAESDAAAAAAAAAEAQALLARMGSQAAEHPELSALVLSSLATMQVWEGRFEEAERTLHAGRMIARKPGCEYPGMNMLERMAWIEYGKGHLRRAAELGEEAMRMSETAGLSVRHSTGAGHLTLAMVALEWDDWPGFRRHLDNAERSTGARYDGIVATVTPLLRAWQHARARDFRQAFAALERVPAAVGGKPLPPWLATRIAMTHAFVHLRRGQVEAAAAALERAEERGLPWMAERAAVAMAAGDRGYAAELLAPVLGGPLPEIFPAVIGARLLMTRIRLEEDDQAGAREMLGQALDLARPEGYRRPFTEAGPWLRKFMHAQPGLAVDLDWLGAPLADGSAAGRLRLVAAPGEPVLTEPLTRRERTVLAMMGQAMSAQDIAIDLFLSVNTVKTHQKSIYRKLLVTRCNDAVRRGRELGII
jgi:LuxR family transcriptional regulator, maltose regulon positive regulatory protein